MTMNRSHYPISSGLHFDSGWDSASSLGDAFKYNFYLVPMAVLYAILNKFITFSHIVLHWGLVILNKLLKANQAARGKAGVSTEADSFQSLFWVIL